MGVVVADTSVLIGFDKIGKLDLLYSLFDSVLIPPAVNKEFGNTTSQITITSPTDKALVTTLSLMLGDGESEAIALASELKADILLDDKKARSIAQELGLKTIGTIGVLIRAKNNKLIPSLKNEIDDLQNMGFYISAELRNMALKLVEEA
jgi:predicted nucleic acid-binding protein